MTENEEQRVVCYIEVLRPSIQDVRNLHTLWTVSEAFQRALIVKKQQGWDGSCAGFSQEYGEWNTTRNAIAQSGTTAQSHALTPNFIIVGMQNFVKWQNYPYLEEWTVACKTNLKSRNRKGKLARDRWTVHHEDTWLMMEAILT